jgi:hypothetical protein
MSILQCDHGPRRCNDLDTQTHRRHNAELISTLSTRRTLCLLAPKTELVAELARWTKTPESEVRQRIRSMFDKGIGPLRMEPLYDSVLADFLIGYMSLTHIDGADIAQHYGQLNPPGSGLSAIGNPEHAPFEKFKRSVEDLEKLLPPLPSSSLRTVLARILRLIAEDAPLTVFRLQADLPPYEQFRISLQPSGGVPVDLTYGPLAIVRKLKGNEEGWPMGTTRTMQGHVLSRLVHLSIPDSLRRKAAREPDVARA